MHCDFTRWLAVLYKMTRGVDTCYTYPGEQVSGTRRVRCGHICWRSTPGIGSPPRTARCRLSPPPRSCRSRWSGTSPTPGFPFPVMMIMMMIVFMMHSSKHGKDGNYGNYAKPFSLRQSEHRSIVLVGPDSKVLQNSRNSHPSHVFRNESLFRLCMLVTRQKRKG